MNTFVPSLSSPSSPSPFSSPPPTSAWSPSPSILVSISKSSTNTTSEHASHAESTEHYVVFTIFVSLTLGALTRHLLKSTKIPYTVVLLLLGIVMGIIGNHAGGEIETYERIANIDPHLLLFVFLPVLLFESSFSLDYHVFMKSLNSILILAVPGVLMATALSAILIKVLLPHDWTWATYFLLGAILSATDPVAVVSLLRELGASKNLATLIEGESLLNDGTAIVIFLVLREVVLDEQEGGEASVDWGGAVLQFLRVSLGGPIIGYVFGHITVWWLSRVFKDALVEITITLGMTYLTFYVSEEFVGVSGVLAVVAYGLILNSVGRTRLQADVEHFLHRFYEMLAYLANTMVFLLSGLVAAKKTTFGIKDLGYLLVLYVIAHVVRAFVVAVLSPGLRRYSRWFSFGDSVLVVYGGLRGSVGLALALLVTIEIGGDIGAKFVFYVAGIVVLTLVVNGSTIRSLLSALGMDKPSRDKLEAMRMSYMHIRSEAKKKLSALKREAFLGEANWDQVRDYSFFPEEPPEEHAPAAPEVDNRFVGRRTSTVAIQRRNSVHGAFMLERANSVGLHMGALPVPEGQGEDESDSDSEASLSEDPDTQPDVAVDATGAVKSPPTKTKKMGKSKSSEKLSRGMIDARRRFLKATRRNYWHQFEENMLGQNAVLLLVSLTDDAIDVDGATVEFAKDIAPHMTIPVDLQRRYDKHKDTPIIGYFLRRAVFDKLFRAFHIGLGYVRAQREVQKLIKVHDDHLPGSDKRDHHHRRQKGFKIITDRKVAEDIMQISVDNAENALRHIYLLREAHPEIAVAIKTVFAGGQVLAHQLQIVKKMKEEGGIDEEMASNLLAGIEECQKRLRFHPPQVKSPDPESFLREAAWLSSVSQKDKVVRAIMREADTKEFRAGEALVNYGDESDGLYLVLRGVVRIAKGEEILAIEGPGTMFGELSVLTGGTRKADVLAETHVKAIFVHNKVMTALMDEHRSLRFQLWDYAGRKIAETVLGREEQFKNMKPGDLRLWVQTGEIKIFDDHRNTSRLARSVLIVPHVAVLLRGSVRHKNSPQDDWAPDVVSGLRIFQSPSMLEAYERPKIFVLGDPAEAAKVDLDDEHFDPKVSRTSTGDSRASFHGDSRSGTPHPPDTEGARSRKQSRKSSHARSAINGHSSRNVHQPGDESGSSEDESATSGPVHVHRRQSSKFSSYTSAHDPISRSGHSPFGRQPSHSPILELPRGSSPPASGSSSESRASAQDPDDELLHSTARQRMSHITIEAPDTKRAAAHEVSSRKSVQSLRRHPTSHLVPADHHKAMNILEASERDASADGQFDFTPSPRSVRSPQPPVSDESEIDTPLTPRVAGHSLSDAYGHSGISGGLIPVMPSLPPVQGNLRGSHPRRKLKPHRSHSDVKRSSHKSKPHRSQTDVHDADQVEMAGTHSNGSPGDAFRDRLMNANIPGQVSEAEPRTNAELGE